MPWIDIPQAPGAQRAKASVRESRAGFEIRNAAADEAELLIYDEIDSWWGVAAADIIAELATITAPNLRVRVNSPGGSVFEGLAIANALRSHPANVVVQIDGLAASIASVIAVAGDRLVMMPNSMLMVHDASGLCIGDATDMQQMGAVLDKISDNIAGAYAAKAGGTAADWRATMRAETWYLADEAVEAGLADEAIPAAGAATEPDADDAMHATWDLAVYGYQGPPKPAAPKPGPPPAPAQADEEQQPTLVISIADILDDDAIARLRAAAQPPEDVSTEPAGMRPDETAAGPTTPPVAVEPAAPTAPADDDPSFADLMARLTTPRTLTWADVIKPLIGTTSSSSATES